MRAPRQLWVPGTRGLLVLGVEDLPGCGYCFGNIGAENGIFRFAQRQMQEATLVVAFAAYRRKFES